jgi:hypothetical protein
MSGTPSDYGERLQREWNIPATQTRYHHKGNFYMPLTHFPGALADPNGYVLFQTEQDLQGCSDIQWRGVGTRNLRLGIPRGISKLPAYVKKRG